MTLMILLKRAELPYRQDGVAALATGRLVSRPPIFFRSPLLLATLRRASMAAWARGEDEMSKKKKMEL